MTTLLLLLALAEPIPHEPQRAGDATLGQKVLHDGAYVGCGLPKRIHDRVAGPTLAYNMGAFTTTRGVEVVAGNCLVCHAAKLDGELVIGLGARLDFTRDRAAGAELARLIARPGKERQELDRWLSRVDAVRPHIRTRTPGENPANNLAAALFSHRDPETLAWSDKTLMEPPSSPLPVDVPAWWQLKKKSALYWTGSGRGDHARLMMTASTLCVDERKEAEAIDASFPDVRAYLLSLEAPTYKGTVDEKLSAHGATVYQRRCASCHGDDEAYPNLLVPVDEVGTDPALALQDDQRFRDWFNGSFYGERARLVRTGAYVAPPLDGVFATAPYLHNGSLQTLEQVLDSRARPREDRTPGYSNRGHLYGDRLSSADRRALLEYLKTL